VIGNAYAGTQAAPANGLLVQGNTGIGTSTVVAAAGTAKALQVNNTLVLTPSDSSSGYAQAGALYFDNVTKRFKYYDVTTATWKNLGGKLGTTVIENTRTMQSNNQPVTTGTPLVDNDVGCPEGYVLVGIQLYTRNNCPKSCNFYSGKIMRMGALCAPLE
jgi:predicted extracellular nuclease